MELMGIFTLENHMAEFFGICVFLEKRTADCQQGLSQEKQVHNQCSQTWQGSDKAISGKCSLGNCSVVNEGWND